MKLKKGMIIKKVGGQTVAVATGESALCFRGMMVLNDTAEFIIRQLINGSESASSVARGLCDEYNVEYEKALLDVTSLIEKLNENGLMEN